MERARGDEESGRGAAPKGEGPGNCGRHAFPVCERPPAGKGVTKLAKPNFEYQKRQKELEKKKKKEEKLQRRLEKKSALAEGAPEAPPEAGVQAPDKAP